MSRRQRQRVTMVGGRISRNHNDSASLKRIVFVIVLVFLMAITNPANKDIMPRKLREIWRQNRRQSNLGFSPVFGKTNYALFSMEARQKDVLFSGLLNSIPCPYDNEHVGEICIWIGDNFCHSKPLVWDPADRAYTAHRIICILLIISTFFSFVGYPIGSWTKNPILNALLNVFQTDGSILSLILDLTKSCLIVYPALVELSRMGPLLPHGLVGIRDFRSSADFLCAVVLLIGVLGGGSNRLAMYLVNEPCVGYDAATGVALGYLNMVMAQPMPFNFQGNRINPITFFWAYSPFTAIRAVGGSPATAIAWIIGVVAGSAVGQHHAQSQNHLVAFFDRFLNLR